MSEFIQTHKKKIAAVMTVGAFALGAREFASNPSSPHPAPQPTERSTSYLSHDAPDPLVARHNETPEQMVERANHGNVPDGQLLLDAASLVQSRGSISVYGPDGAVSHDVHEGDRIDVPVLTSAQIAADGDPSVSGS